MKITTKYLLIVLFSLLFSACNSNDNKTNSPQNEIADNSTNSKKSSAINSPCEFISVDEVKSMFEVTEHAIEMQDVIYTYPTCIFKWEDGKVTRTRSFGGQEIKSTMPSEVLIVMVKDANENMFQRSTKIYKQPQEIANVGAKAIWDSRISQLTFLSNSYIFHIHVRVSNKDDENKEKAIEAAKLIITKI